VAGFASLPVLWGRMAQDLSPSPPLFLLSLCSCPLFHTLPLHPRSERAEDIYRIVSHHLDIPLEDVGGRGAQPACGGAAHATHTCQRSRLQLEQLGLAWSRGLPCASTVPCATVACTHFMPSLQARSQT